MEIKTKINKWDLLQPKIFYTKAFCKQNEKITGWEKIFANDVMDKRFVSKIYKYFLMLNSIKVNNPINN